MALYIEAYDKLEFVAEKLNDGKKGIVKLSKCKDDFTDNPNSMKEGYYQYTGNNKSVIRTLFIPYMSWRNELSLIINGIDGDSILEEYDKWGDLKPEWKMMDLIFFSNKDGFIATERCIELSKEFDDNLDYILSKTDNDLFINTYIAFQKAFKVASDNGAVLFLNNIPNHID